jgi:membrane-bound metal-dependent hydrolase YbcI (DUF457 family)
MPLNIIMTDKKIKPYVRYIITVMFVIGIWICLELFLKYWFFYSEQQQLFLFSSDYCRNLLIGQGTIPFRPGGLLGPLFPIYRTVFLLAFCRFLGNCFDYCFVGMAALWRDEAHVSLEDAFSALLFPEFHLLVVNPRLICLL